MKATQKSQLASLFIALTVILGVAFVLLANQLRNQSTELRSHAQGIDPYAGEPPGPTCEGIFKNNTCYSAAEYMRWKALNCNKFTPCPDDPDVELTDEEKAFVNQSLPKCNVVLNYMGAACK